MRKYYLGLDIGTSSCGWAVTDENYYVLRGRGKDLWGVRLFAPAKTAVERRQKRTNRRRLDRQKLRLNWLNEIFAPEIAKVDEKFLIRLKYSNLLLEDKQKFGLQGKNSIFFGEVDGKKYTDKDYFEEYPTIYRLRRELIQMPARDIRFLYLALHNIIKRRGHFLYAGEFGEKTDAFSFVNGAIKKMNELNDETKEFDLREITQDINEKLIKSVCSKKGLRQTKTEFCTLLNAQTKKEKAFASALVDGKVSIKQLFAVEVENDKLEFSSETVDEAFEKLSAFISDDEMFVLSQMKEGYSCFQLKAILGDKTYICEALDESYKTHHNQLKYFKNFIKIYYPEEYFGLFRNNRDNTKVKDIAVGYAQYVNCNLVDGKKGATNINASGSKRERNEFYKYVKNILKKPPKNVDNLEKFEQEKNEILNLIENDAFLLKQRSKTNTVFPNKIYKAELQKILEINAAKFDFLNQKDETGLTNAEKIMEIFQFKIPYFVGPISENRDEKSNGWAIKERNLDFKPWTIEKIVDFNKAEDDFIARMTNKCSYLKNEDVLPKQSIIYSKYRVLNELNRLQLNGKNISVELKQRIFTGLFKTRSKVTVKMLKEYLVAEGEYSKSEMNDIDIGGIDKEFANNYSSFAVFNNSDLFGKQFIENNLSLLEKVIKYHTIISDKNRLVQRLKKEFGNVLSTQQIKFIKGLNFKDWGSLSHEFLVGLKFVNKVTGEITCVLDEMWNTNQNLQQVLNNTDYTLKDLLNNGEEKAIENLVYDDVQSLYCSPAVKRGVWQSLQIIKEICAVMGGMPEKVFVEVSRHDDKKGDDGRKLSRKNNIENFYKSKDFKKSVYITADEITNLLKELNGKDVNELRAEKLYLYFLQAGKCAYSGSKINIAELNNDYLYDVDHIIPRSIIKDDSINNKVLVKTELNKLKDDNTVPLEIISKQKDFWKALVENKMMSKEKYDRLIRTEPWTDEELGNFIARQLVETNQSVMAVIDCLKQYMDNPRKIVYSKACFVSDFRHLEGFELYKSRLVNDFHHAQDAYLNIVVGNILFSRFSDDPRNFYKSKNKNSKLTKNIDKIFKGDIYSPITNEIIWSKQRDLERIKKTCLKNSPIVSYMNFSNLNGAFYNETVHKSKKNNKASGAKFALKGKTDNPLNDFEKYGGYSDISNAYFMVVESKDKKGRVLKTIEAVPIFAVRQYINKPNYEENILNYVAKAEGLNEPRVLINKINLMSTLLIGKGEYYISGKSDTTYLLHNANQLFLDKNTINYIRIIEKYQKIVATKMDETLEQTEEMIIVSKPKKEGNKALILNKTENEKLYSLLIDKLSMNCYKDMQLDTVLREKLLNRKADFEKLNVKDQAILLYNVLRRTSSGATKADLKLLQEGSAEASIRIGKNITNKNIVLVQRSVTGLYEKRIRL